MIQAALLVLLALSAPHGARARPAPPPAKRAADFTTVRTAELVQRVRQLFADLEYDKVIPVASELITRGDLAPDQLLDAYLLKGSALAIVGDPIEAEKPFRHLLRGRPDYEMPPDTSPKILAVFRKVQVEERAIVVETRRAEREKMVKELVLAGSPPGRGEGGLPIAFRYRLRDPRSVVAEVAVQYRRRGERGYSALALKPDELGVWTGEIPGEWTASAADFVLEYFAVTLDGRGEELLKTGDATAPEIIEIAAGSVADQQPILESPWFWVILSGVVVASGTAGYLLYRDATALPGSDLGEFRVP